MQFRTIKVKEHYKGLLSCQFEVVNTQKVGNQPLHGEFSLDGPFRLSEYEKISDEELRNWEKELENSPYFIENINVRNSSKGDISDSSIEFLSDNKNWRSHLEIVRLKDSGSGIFNFQDEPKKSDDDSFGDFVNTEAIDISKSYGVIKSEKRHGRVKALSVITIYREIREEVVAPPEILIEDKSNCIAHTKEGQQCKNRALANSLYCQLHSRSRISAISDSPVVETQPKPGCFGKPKSGELLGSDSTFFNRFLKPLGVEHAGMNGCFSGAHSNPAGCFSNRLPLWRRMGCGLSPLLLLLLFGLLYCILSGDCNCSGNQSNQSALRQDTVYVEVLKEKVDTLKIVQMDTVSIVDSTFTRTTQMVPLPNVQFKTDSDVLLPSSARDLTQLAEYMLKNDKLTAVVYGHTDSLGDENHNLELSQKRAESVKNYLMKFGVEESRIQAKGMGSSKSKADNRTLEGRLMNRRVEVVLESTEDSETKRTIEDSPPRQFRDTSLIRNEP